MEQRKRRIGEGVTKSVRERERERERKGGGGGGEIRRGRGEGKHSSSLPVKASMCINLTAE